jgi:hypothetical protein
MTDDAFTKNFDKLRKIADAHPGITVPEALRFLAPSEFPQDSLTYDDWQLLQTILIDHATQCMRELKASSVNAVGILLLERDDKTRKLMAKICDVLRDRDEEET